MIIDLDAHQGNGPERDFMDDPNIFIIDSYNPDIYPYDFQAKKSIMVDIPIFSSDDDESYINKLFNNFEEVERNFNKFRPDFILYNAGTDILTNDPMGSKLNLSLK